MSFKLGAVLAGLVIAGSTMNSKPAAACVGDGSQFLGSVCVVAYDFCPRGFARLFGQQESISENQALFSLLGDIYGGDSRTVFGIPDMRGRSAVGTGQGIALTNVNLGQWRGSETNTLTIGQLPRHTHIASYIPTSSLQVDVKLYARDAPGIDPAPGPDVQLAIGNFDSGGSTTIVKNYGPPLVGQEVELNGIQVSGGTITGGDVVLGSAGGTPASGATNPFPVTPPQLGLTWCIAIDGNYPPRPD